jgi:hypothetical protein
MLICQRVRELLLKASIPATFLMSSKLNVLLTSDIRELGNSLSYRQHNYTILRKSLMNAFCIKSLGTPSHPHRVTIAMDGQAHVYSWVCR